MSRIYPRCVRCGTLIKAPSERCSDGGYCSEQKASPMPSKGEWKPMPLDRVRFNAGVRCDMLIGACTCGATHDDRDPTQPAARGPSVAPMNRCARIVGPYQCGRLSCHTGACEFRDHTGHVVEAAPSSGAARDHDQDDASVGEVTALRALADTARLVIEEWESRGLSMSFGPIKEMRRKLHGVEVASGPFTRPADQHPDGGSLRFGKEVCPECKAPRDKHDEWDFRFCPRASDAKGPAR